MSVPTSGSSNCQASGLRYGMVPTSAPDWVMVDMSLMWATPKSVRRGVPSSASSTFCGLMSRWMIFTRCARTNASARSIAISSARASSNGRSRLSSLSSEPPPTYSITI